MKTQTLIASEMVAVLESDELKSLLQQEDGVGNITSIAFHSIMSADAATYYKITFYSGIAIGKSACSAVAARIDGVDYNIKITKSTCD